MTLTQRVTALEAEVKKLRDMFKKVPPAPAPTTPAPTSPVPSPAPSPAAGPQVPFTLLPKILGSTEIGTGMLQREMAKAAPGWTADRGRWYVQGSPTEMGSQATQPSGVFKHGDMVVYKEWFTDAVGQTAEVQSLPFGPMKIPGHEFVVVAGNAQL